MTDRWLALKVVMMPKDANPLPGIVTMPSGGNYPLYNTIFGGVLLSYIDQAGAIGARHEVVGQKGEPPMLVTVAINRVEFKKPVLVGDVVSFWTRLVRIGRTSVTMVVQVEAERGPVRIDVTEAELVYVGIDPLSPDRKPKALLANTKSG
jgi:acyl-CoA thioesterase YciA